MSWGTSFKALEKRNRKAAQSSSQRAAKPGMEKPLRLFALLRVLCGFKIPWPARFVPPRILLQKKPLFQRVVFLL